jgi:oxygen-independent coproporphyrinogen III oxidase
MAQAGIVPTINKLAQYNNMLSAYIHIPFCVTKCPYCGFYSTGYDSLLVDRFLEALAIEMKDRLRDPRCGQFGSVYIGGGTPSTLSPEQFSRLFDLIDEHLTLDVGAEITVEANPNSATAEKLAVLKSRGATRISIGAQSFDETVLASLGRAHSADTARTAVRSARTAGFSNIGLDLMYGVPGQAEEQWQRTLEAALSLEPGHLSVYCLSLDEGSKLSQEAKAGRVTLPDEDTTARMYHTAARVFAEAGYRHYEISNFCKPGRECRHNNNYWDRGEYVGFGPGAWSFIGNSRTATIANVSEYILRMTNSIDAVATREVLDREQEASEILLLGLRKTTGIDVDHFERLFGSAAKDDLMMKIGKLDGTGLFRMHHSRLSLTMRGFMLSNEALAAILP